MTSKELIDKIDLKSSEMISKKLSRFDIEFSRWSYDFNKELKIKINKAKGDKKALLKYVFPYWQNRAKMIELIFKNRDTFFWPQKDVKRFKVLEEIVRDLKELINKERVI